MFFRNIGFVIPSIIGKDRIIQPLSLFNSLKIAREWKKYGNFMENFTK